MFEVIVIDNGSTDDTKGVCESYSSRIKNLRYFYDDKPGLHVGRHLGMKMADSEVLVYGDDDIVAFPYWLEGIAESFQDPEVVLVGGKDLPEFEIKPPDWLMKMWDAKDVNGGRNLGYLSILDLGDEIKSIKATEVYGCNFAVRKSVLLEAGGFHPDGMPHSLIRYRGDGESYLSRFIQEKGYRTLYHPKASVYHLVTNNRMTVDYFCARAFNQGVSDSFTDLRNAHQNNISNRNITTLAMAVSRMRENPYDFAFRVGRRLMRAFFFLFPTESVRIENEIRLSYRNGYAFHQKEVSNDPQLLKWVLRENFFD
jgi:glycosyltransferase involved in cell wall biosynthesis